MKIRKSNRADIPSIMEIISHAQSLLRSGGVDQWQDGYPTAEIIAADIAKSESYLLENNGVILATAVISFTGEITYNTIDGQWINSNPYVVVHRLAVRDAARRSGLAQQLMLYAEALALNRGINDIRVDTHQDNLAMQALLDRLGYTLCGKITLLSGAARIAYQKQLVAK
jgi:GNAT superfamily N-acetyltransferase